MKIVRPKAAAASLGVSRSTLYRWQHTCPDFPKIIKVGPRTSGFDLDELKDWLKGKANRDARP